MRTCQFISPSRLPGLPLIESLPPVLLSFLSGVFLAAAQTVYRGALQWMGPKALTFASNLTLTTYAAAIYMAGAGLEKWPLAGIFWFVMAGFCSHFLSRNLNFISAALIGMARSQIMLQVHPMWSALLAVLLLGETITFPVALGTFAVVFGAIPLVQERGAGACRATPFWHYLHADFGGLFLLLRTAASQDRVSDDTLSRLRHLRHSTHGRAPSTWLDTVRQKP